MPVHAFIFPGQGSQSVGMGRELAASFAAAREVFEEVDETLRQKLSRLMFEGPAEELTLTENTQPALMAVSLAVVRVLERDGGIRLRQKAAVLAGHSLGEYSALAAAGCLTVADTARLLRLRGDAMQRALPPGLGAMAALIGVELAQAEAFCAAAREGPDGAEVVEPANDNGGGQVVISGHQRRRWSGRSRSPKRKGVKRAMLLPVSAPFHCALMAPAAEAMAAGPGRNPAAAAAAGAADRQCQRPPRPPSRRRFARICWSAQVTATVRWRESVQAMTGFAGGGPVCRARRRQAC